MPSTEVVVDALIPQQEARQATVLALGLEAIPPSGEQLVHVALVAHIPHDLVSGALKRPVQRYGKLNHAQVGGKVPSGDGNLLQQELANLCRQLLQLLDR